jgi:PhzF family phenazine biosynthesis protein
VRLPLYQVDAFAGAVFTGNPAAVCPLQGWLGDSLLQGIATENNLSETAFFVTGEGGSCELRWFTPVAEVALCGHATLASAFVLFELLDCGLSRVAFTTRRSGTLTVDKVDGGLAMDFPALTPQPCAPPAGLADALGQMPLEVLGAGERDYLAVFESEDALARLAPDMGALARLDRPGLIVTAPGQRHDFVSRFFAPALGVPEDPVTGSAQCALVPYWASQLGKNEFATAQISRRGGELQCRLAGDRVVIEGNCVLYLEGTITV